MFKIFKILRSNRGSAPLLEVMAVIAIMAITGSVVTPNFMYATERARIRSDIQSTMIIQSAKDLYQLETGSSVGSTIEEVLERLTNSGYLHDRGLETQTDQAAWILQGNLVLLDVRNANLSERIISGLSQSERDVIVGLD